MDLSSFSGGRFNRGAGVGKEFLWIMVSLFLFRFCPFKLSGTKSVLLRLFGAKVGRGMVIKPNVKITFPWKLTLGDNVWLGEECWLLNLERITVADNVCISQRAFLCTGNHNYKSPSFDLIVKPIEIQEGVWIGASAWVGPGVTVGSHAMLAAGSVATTDLQPFGIYQGNPALLVKTRVLNDPPSGKV